MRSYEIYGVPSRKQTAIEDASTKFGLIMADYFGGGNNLHGETIEVRIVKREHLVDDTLRFVINIHSTYNKP